MDINSVNGPAAYAGSIRSANVDNAKNSRLNTGVSQTDLNTRTTPSEQSAFEVNITQEARDRMNSETGGTDGQALTNATEAPAEPQPAQPPENPPAQTVAQEQQTSRILNIVA